MILTTHDKKLLILPVLLLPLLAFLFNAMGGGKGVRSKNRVIGTGLDSSFPSGNTPAISSSMEEIYKRAEEDRNSTMEAIYADSSHLKDSLLSDVNKKQSDWQRQQELSNWKDSLLLSKSNQQQSPVAPPVIAATGLGDITQQSHRENLSLFNDIEFEQAGKKNNTGKRINTSVVIPAAVLSDITISDNSSIELRILEKVQYGENWIQKNAIVTGYCSVTSDRLFVKIKRLPAVEGGAVQGEFQVFDVDNIQGIYAPSGRKDNIGNDIKTEVENVVTSVEPRLSRIAQIFQRRNNNSGKTEISLAEGYRLIIKAVSND